MNGFKLAKRADASFYPPNSPLSIMPTKKEKEVKDAGPQTASEHVTVTKTTAKTTGSDTAGQSMGESRGPVKVLRVDDVSAAVFARERNGRTFYSVSFTRSYKDRDGSWKYTKNFDVEDLGRVVTVAQQSAEWLYAQVAESED